MKEKMKVVAELAVWDSVAGTVEVLDMKYKNDELVSLKVRWIVAALCYSGSYIPTDILKNMYFGEDVIDPKNICEFCNIHVMSEEKICNLRQLDYLDQLKHTKLSEVA